MRRSQPVRLGDLWNEFVASSPGVARRLAEGRAVEAWPEAAGQAIASLTRSVRYERGVMTVSIASAVVRHEVFMQRERLRLRLNELAGMEVVRVLIIR